VDFEGIMYVVAGKNDASRDRSDFARAREDEIFSVPFFFLRRQYGRGGIKIVITTEVYDSTGLKTTLGLCDDREICMSLRRMFLSQKSSTIPLR